MSEPFLIFDKDENEAMRDSIVRSVVLLINHITNCLADKSLYENK